MKSKSKNIIKTLLLSATVALFHGTAKADAKKVFALDLDLGLVWGVKRNVHVDGGGIMGLVRGISVN